MFGLSPSTFYLPIPPSFICLPSQDMTSTSFLTSTPDGKRKQSDNASISLKRFCHTYADRPVKKCSFNIESLLELKTKSSCIPNQSYNEDTDDGSSDGDDDDDGQQSFRSPPFSSYGMLHQLTTSNRKSELTPSSSSESDHSPYRLTSSKHANSSRHALGAKSKPKRIRTIFTPEQLERLETEFDKQQYMVGNERFYLATTLDLTEAQVKVWFQNRRIKWRRQALDDHQQRLTSIVGNLAGTPASAAAASLPTNAGDSLDDDHHHHQSDSDE